MKYLYAKADYDSMAEKIDWKGEFSSKTINNAWNFFRDKVLEVSDRYTPKKISEKVNVRNHGWTQPHWQMLKKKHQLYRRWRRTKTEEDRKMYTRASNQVNWMCKKAVRRLEKDIASGVKENPKAFWSYVKTKITARESIGSLIKSDGTTTETDIEKSQVLQDFFISVFTREDLQNMPTPPEIDLELALTIFAVVPSDVFEFLRNLKPNKSQGPDGLHPRLLQRLAGVLDVPLTLLFKLSLKKGELPLDWKSANVMPIFKKGNKQESRNYRPVSLTCVVCKIFECMVRKHIIKHLSTNEMLSAHQHCFVTGHSCTTHLLEVLNDWTHILEEGDNIDAIYMDFMKAFDSVPHYRLLQKVEAFGIQVETLGWIKAFLVGRRQRVVVKGQRSEWSSVLSGIPQGSVLGPLLFLIYINDLPDFIESRIKLFADDTKLYARCDTYEDSQKLQDDLIKIQEWSDTWQLRFHPEKCTVLKIGRFPSSYDYRMKNGNESTILKESKVERDLGVLVDSKLTFEDHISHVISRSNRLLGVIRRSFANMDTDTFKLLYIGLVRSVLEYGQAAWSPYRIGEQKRLESVQRRATKMVPSLKNLPYETRLRYLKLPSLAHRRKRGDMIDVYKYLHGLYTNQTNLLHLCKENRTRGHTLKLEKTFSHLDIRKFFFSNRVVDTWNSLSEEVVNAPSVNAFKNKLDNYWKKSPSVL